VPELLNGRADDAFSRDAPGGGLLKEMGKGKFKEFIDTGDYFYIYSRTKEEKERC